MKVVKRTARRRQEMRAAVSAIPSSRTADGNGTNVPEDPRRAVEPFVCPTVEDWLPPTSWRKPTREVSDGALSIF
jgi:hypothetical protein